MKFCSQFLSRQLRKEKQIIQGECSNTTSHTIPRYLITSVQVTSVKSNTYDNYVKKTK